MSAEDDFWNSVTRNRDSFSEDVADLEEDLRSREAELQSLDGLRDVSVGRTSVPLHIGQPYFMDVTQEEFEDMSPMEKEQLIDEIHRRGMHVNAIQSGVEEWHAENLGRAVRKQSLRPMFENDAAYAAVDTDDESDDPDSPPSFASVAKGASKVPVEPAEHIIGNYIADAARRTTQKGRRRGTKKRRKTRAKKRRTIRTGKLGGKYYMQRGRRVYVK
jgi:hypothetical protein